MVIETIRNAILENETKSGAFDAVAKDLNITRAKAKELCFRFHWFPTEEFMQKCLDSEEVGIDYAV